MAGRADAGRATDESLRARTERTRLGGAGALVAAVALVAFPSETPFVAVLGAVVVLGSWYLLAPSYAFAFGHVALAAVLPEAGMLSEAGAVAEAGTVALGSDLLWLTAVEVGLVGMLVASVAGGAWRDDETGPRRTSTALVGAGIVLGWVAGGGVLSLASVRSSVGLQTAGGVLVVSAGIAAYALHRYQLVSLGLVGHSSIDADADAGEADEHGETSEADDRDESRGRDKSDDTGDSDE
jgi:hypothetical protein